MLALTADTVVDLRRSMLVHGGGVFETVHVHRGVPLFLAAHLRRMGEGLALLGMPPAPPEAAVREFLGRFLRERGLRETGLRLVAVDDRLVVLERELYPRPASVALGLARDVRRCTRAALTGVKSTSYLENRLLTRRAAAADLFDTLALNEHERLTDGGRCNVMLALDGALVTPPLADGCLPGVTRGVLLAAGAVTERPLTVADLERAAGACVTSSLAGVLPVHAVAGVTTFDPDHPLVRAAAAAYAAAVAAEIAGREG